MAVPVPRPRVHVTNNPFVRPDDYTPDRVHERTDDAVVRDALPNNGRRGSDGGGGGGQIERARSINSLWKTDGGGLDHGRPRKLVGRERPKKDAGSYTVYIFPSSFRSAGGY